MVLDISSPSTANHNPFIGYDEGNTQQPHRDEGHFIFSKSQWALIGGGVVGACTLTFLGATLLPTLFRGYAGVLFLNSLGGIIGTDATSELGGIQQTTLGRFLTKEDSNVSALVSHYGSRLASGMIVSGGIGILGMGVGGVATTMAKNSHLLVKASGLMLTGLGKVLDWTDNGVASSIKQLVAKTIPREFLEESAQNAADEQCSGLGNVMAVLGGSTLAVTSVNPLTHGLAALAAIPFLGAALLSPSFDYTAYQRAVEAGRTALPTETHNLWGQPITVMPQAWVEVFMRAEQNPGNRQTLIANPTDPSRADIWVCFSAREGYVIGRARNRQGQQPPEVSEALVVGGRITNSQPQLLYEGSDTRLMEGNLLRIGNNPPMLFLLPSHLEERQRRLEEARAEELEHKRLDGVRATFFEELRTLERVEVNFGTTSADEVWQEVQGGYTYAVRMPEVVAAALQEADQNPGREVAVQYDGLFLMEVEYKNGSFTIRASSLYGGGKKQGSFSSVYVTDFGLVRSESGERVRITVSPNSSDIYLIQLAPDVPPFLLDLSSYCKPAVVQDPIAPKPPSTPPATAAPIRRLTTQPMPRDVAETLRRLRPGDKGWTIVTIGDVMFYVRLQGKGPNIEITRMQGQATAYVVSPPYISLEGFRVIIPVASKDSPAFLAPQDGVRVGKDGPVMVFDPSIARHDVTAEITRILSGARVITEDIYFEISDTGQVEAVGHQFPNKRITSGTHILSLTSNGWRLQRPSKRTMVPVRVDGKSVADSLIQVELGINTENSEVVMGEVGVIIPPAHPLVIARRMVTNCQHAESVEQALATRVYNNTIDAQLYGGRATPTTYTLGSGSYAMIQFPPVELGETTVAGRHLTVSFMPLRLQEGYTIRELRYSGEAPAYGTYYRRFADHEEAYYRLGDEPIEGLQPGDMVLAGDQMLRLPAFPTAEQIAAERKRREALAEVRRAEDEAEDRRRAERRQRE